MSKSFIGSAPKMGFDPIVSLATSTSPLGQYQGPKPLYWRRSSTYRAIVQDYQTPILVAQSLATEIDNAKAEILSGSVAAKIGRVFLWTYMGVAAVIFAIPLFVLFWHNLPRNAATLFALLNYFGISYLLLSRCYKFLQDHYDRLQKAILTKNHSKFDSLEAKLSDIKTLCEQAEQKMLAAWDRFCVTSNGYPPDWNERKQLVKMRDDFQCTDCGWPTGQHVRRRNLHVHHIRNLSNGGDNSIDNLTTLCHICHRKQEGHGHKRIRYRRQA